METKEAVQKTGKRIPIREDLLTSPLDDLSKVKLRGSRCTNCGEVFMGKVFSCANCSEDKFEDILFSNNGFLYTYTVIQYQPPADYRGKTDPFEPFVEGLVELPEGIRIVAPVREIKLEDVKIETPLELVVHDFFVDKDGNTVVAFYYKPSKTPVKKAAKTKKGSK